MPINSKDKPQSNSPTRRIIYQTKHQFGRRWCCKSSLSEGGTFETCRRPSELITLKKDKIGTSSCRYRLGIFQPAVGEGDDSGPGSVAAHGYFVHVFVDAASHRPVAIPDKLRAAMEALR